MANKTFDALGLIVEDEVVGATASCTGANIDGLSVGDASYLVALQTTVTTGTVDGSNYYTLQVQVSDAVGGTYANVGEALTLPATYQIGLTAEQINHATSGADYFRVTATKVGTTATAVTYTAFVSMI